jgi:hypothetical protein
MYIISSRTSSGLKLTDMIFPTSGLGECWVFVARWFRSIGKLKVPLSGDLLMEDLRVQMVRMSRVSLTGIELLDVYKGENYDRIGLELVTCNKGNVIFPKFLDNI